MAAIAHDEARHRHVFAALAAVLDQDDRLATDADASALAERLAEISPWFLPAEHRPAPGSASAAEVAPAPLGTGGRVAVATAAEADGPRPAVVEALRASGVLESVAPGGTVAIRTSFMVGYDRADRSNVVDVDVLDEVAALLRAAGAADVAVLESPTVYDRYVRNRSVHEVAAYFGYDSDRYRIVDAEADQVACEYPRGLGQTTISRTWLEADHRLVLAKATTDPCEYGHLCLSTLNGTGGRVESTVYFGRYTDFRSATMMVLDLAPPDLALVDAWGPVADGPVGVMGSHRPCFPRRIYCGADAIATDLAVLADMGAPDLQAVPILAAASQWLGIELTAPEAVGATGRWGGGYRGPDSNPWDRLVCRLALPMYTYGGAQGARFVPRFDAVAFPDERQVRIDIRISRALAQRVFGLHPAKD